MVESKKGTQKGVKKAAKEKTPRTIGPGIQAPEKNCGSDKCPFCGTLSVRGRVLQGTVIASKMHQTVTVERTRRHYIPKYERYEKRRTRLIVHNPDCMGATVGDEVRIMETRPLSKTKHFVVVERKIAG